MFVILKMNHAVPNCKPQAFSPALRCAISQSDVVYLLTGINRGVRQPRSHDFKLYVGHCSRERTSADVCLKSFPGSYMKLTLTMKSCCMVGLTSPVLLTVKR
jgi:hypothetical protein